MRRVYRARGWPARSILHVASGDVGSREVTTIEAIGQKESRRRIQQAWLELGVVQCGYCQSGQIMGRPDIPSDPRFSDPANLKTNEVFGVQAMSYWHDVFNGVHVTFGAVRGPQEVISDPQLRTNDVIVSLDGAGDKLTSTISSPIQVQGVAKIPARRAPEVGEHNDDILGQLGFDAGE
jgi:crotonobetainyl-CoA:carnitine CoA-transferase CaiB-like acyl-CoA transferase